MHDTTFAPLTAAGQSTTRSCAHPGSPPNSTSNRVPGRRASDDRPAMALARLRECAQPLAAATTEAHAESEEDESSDQQRPERHPRERWQLSALEGRAHAGQALGLKHNRRGHLLGSRNVQRELMSHKKPADRGEDSSDCGGRHEMAGAQHQKA